MLILVCLEDIHQKNTITHHFEFKYLPNKGDLIRFADVAYRIEDIHHIFKNSTKAGLIHEIKINATNYRY